MDKPAFTQQDNATVSSSHERPAAEQPGSESPAAGQQGGGSASDEESTPEQLGSGNRRAAALRLLSTAALSVAGGFLFTLLHIPLPWMLGPMTVMLIAGLRPGNRAYWPVGLRNAGLTVLGYVMGIPFTLETARQIALQLPTMFGVTVLLVTAGILLGIPVGRFAGLSVPTSVIGSIPGGLSQMVVLAEETDDADVTVVTFMQTIRMLSVVFVVPFIAIHGLGDGGAAGAGVSGAAPAVSATGGTWASLAGAEFLPFVPMIVLGGWAAARLRLPTPYMMGPLFGSAVLVLAGFHALKLPALAVIVAQVLVGTHVGIGMRLSSLANWRKLLPLAAVGGVGIVLMSLLTGIALTWWHPLTLATAFLGTAPGGMSEMGVTAMAVQADLSMVTAYQMFRILFILFIVPPLLKWYLLRRAGRRKG